MSLFRCEELYGEIEMRKKRVIFFIIMIILLFGILAVRMVDLQMFKGKLMEEYAEALGSQSSRLCAVRGEILDRNSKVLVTNESTFYLTVDESADDRTVNILSKILNKPITKDDNKLCQPFIFAQNITKEQAVILSEHNLQGVSISDGYERKTDGGRISHLEGSGKTTEFPAKDGCFVELCIDKELQKKCEDELSAAVDEVNRSRNVCGGGGAVVIDVKNGDVLAMSSYPDYDISTYAQDYDSLISDERNPVLNRCISGRYEPGSVYKPVVALAALSEGVISKDEKILDRGIYTFYAPSYMPACHIWTSKNETHGNVNVSEALSKSCNYYFYEVGRRLGISKIAEYGEKFCLNSKCGIELSGEEEGIIASPKTKENWVSGDTLQAAIGQSVNMFTPLSLARYTAAIANGGYVYKPHIVKRIAQYDGKTEYERKTELQSKVDVSPEFFDAVKEGMRLCCTTGTAKQAFSDKGYSAGGKTGTAQVPSGPENGLFIGFAPYDNPEIAVCVVIEHGSGEYTALAASEIMSEWIVNRGNR